MYKKGDFEAAVVSYKTSLSFCPLGDEYNKDRVCTGRDHDLEAIFFCNMAAAQIELVGLLAKRYR